VWTIFRRNTPYRNADACRERQDRGTCYVSKDSDDDANDDGANDDDKDDDDDGANDDDKDDDDDDDDDNKDDDANANAIGATATFHESL
jgi:hypothetical protein